MLRVALRSVKHIFVIVSFSYIVCLAFRILCRVSNVHNEIQFSEFRSLVRTVLAIFVGKPHRLAFVFYQAPVCHDSASTTERRLAKIGLAIQFGPVFFGGLCDGVGLRVELLRIEFFGASGSLSESAEPHQYLN